MNARTEFAPKSNSRAFYTKTRFCFWSNIDGFLSGNFSKANLATSFGNNYRGLVLDDIMVFRIKVIRWDNGGKLTSGPTRVVTDIANVSLGKLPFLITSSEGKTN